MANYKIVGGPLPFDIKVLDPNGNEVKGVTEISISRLTSTDLAKAAIIVPVELDLEIDADIARAVGPAEHVLVNLIAGATLDNPRGRLRAL